MRRYAPPFAGRIGALARSAMDPETDAERNLRVLTTRPPCELEWRRTLIRSDAATLRLAILTGHLGPEPHRLIEGRLETLTAHRAQDPSHPSYQSQHPS